MLEGERLLVQHRGSVLEIFDLKTNRRVWKFSGIGVSSPDGRLIAYKKGGSHIQLTEVENSFPATRTAEIRMTLVSYACFLT